MNHPTSCVYEVNSIRNLSNSDCFLRIFFTLVPTDLKIPLYITKENLITAPRLQRNRFNHMLLVCNEKHNSRIGVEIKKKATILHFI